MSGVWPYIAALIPSAGVGVLFWLVIKNMMEGDRKERLAHSQWEAAHSPKEEGREEDREEGRREDRLEEPDISTNSGAEHKEG
jgi:hypothetical protein